MMHSGIDRQFADEIARRAARRLEILREESPDLLARRLSDLEPDALEELLRLTRLPPGLADREPPRHHLGVAGVDHCTEELVLEDSDAGEGEEAALSDLDDDDLLAARRYVPETLPGYLLG